MSILNAILIILDSFIDFISTVVVKKDVFKVRNF